ncbi:MAG: hypothetical protein OEY77_14525 [Nitrospira sp.]|nr:hypothetical protein [Nitrospira sp.]
MTSCDAVVVWDAALLRESLYKAVLGEWCLGFDTILKVTKATVSHY